MEAKTKQLPITASITTLANLYGVSLPTMKVWLKKIGMDRPSVGRIYNAKETKTIFMKLDLP